MVAANLYKTYNRIIKTIIVIFAVFFLYNQFFIKDNLSEIFALLESLISKEKFLIYTIPVLLLMPLNWLLEAIKWQKSVASNEHISISTALKAVFAGTTISSVSVNRTGEFIGRVSVLKKHSFWQGTVVTFVGSYAQTFNTFLWGSISACILLFSSDINFGINKLLLIFVFLIIFVSLIIFLFFYFNCIFIANLYNI